MVLEIIIIILFLTTLFNVILNKLNMPTIIGYILTGIVLAYSFDLHHTVSNEDLKLIAEFGIVFLMFTIGLEFSVKTLIKMKKYVFIYGGLQVFVTALIFFLILNNFFNFNVIESLVIALGLALFSTAIVLKILSETGEINKPYGQKSVGILIFQDLVVIPILLLITILSIDNINIGELIFKTSYSLVFLIIFVIIFGKYFLDRILYKIVKTKSNEIFIGFIFLLIFGVSYLAHFLGFTYSLGAFIAGLLIAETYYKHKVEADLIPFRDLLLGIFFITVGMQLKFDIIFENISLILTILVIFLIIKLAIIFFIIKFSNNKKIALKTALSLFQFGEFGIVIFDLASFKNLISTEISQILIVIIIISMIITPFILKNIDLLVDILTGKNLKCEKYKIGKNFKNHIVLIGYGRLGKIISDLLEQHKLDYIIIESNIDAFKRGKQDEKPIILGSAYKENFLKSINIEKAKNIIISVGKSEKIYLISDIIKKINIDANIIIKVNYEEEKELLKKLNIKNIIVEGEETAKNIIKLLKI